MSLKPLRGMEAAIDEFGSEVDPAGQVETAWLWAIPALGLLGLLALHGRGFGSFAAFAAGALGIAGMALVTFQLLRVGRDLAETAFLRLQVKQGYWMTWAGFLWLLAYPLVTRRWTAARRKPDRRPTAHRA